MKILLLILLVMTLVSCGDETIDNDVDTTTTEATSNTIEVAEENLPTKDFKGYDFKILVYSNMTEEFDASEIDGEPINDAVYTRNMSVAEKYNVNFNIISKENDDYQNTVRANYTAGDHEYDLYQMFISAAASGFAPTGCFQDWNIIPYVKDNLHNEWWNQSSINDLQLNKKNYLINGDIAFHTIGCTMSIVFNKNIFDDYNLDYPYQKVTDGEWTLDYMKEIIKDRNYDINSDGNMKVTDDFYGFTSSEWVAPIGFFVGSDLNTITFDDSGLPALNYMSEKTVSAYDKVYSILITEDCPLVAYTTDLINNHATKAFMENRSMMSAIHLKDIRLLREMDSEFGIIPFPKYDEIQSDYISAVDAGTSTSAVLVTNPDMERTGLIVEALAEASYDTIIKAFYDITLQSKASRDEDSLDMLDIIRNTMKFDPLYVYNFGGFGFSFKDWVISKTTDIVSKYEKIEGNVINDIQKFIDLTNENA